jgi:hypothetical protein
MAKQQKKPASKPTYAGRVITGTIAKTAPTGTVAGLAALNAALTQKQPKKKR